MATVKGKAYLTDREFEKNAARNANEGICEILNGESYRY